jgi:hypothetical protein
VCHDGSWTIREVAMRAQALAHEIIIDSVDQEALDKFLRSDRRAWSPKLATPATSATVRRGA